MHMREVSEPCSKGSCSVGKRPGVGGEEGGVGGWAQVHKRAHSRSESPQTEAGAPSPCSLASLHIPLSQRSRSTRVLANGDTAAIRLGISGPLHSAAVY